MRTMQTMLFDNIHEEVLLKLRRFPISVRRVYNDMRRLYENVRRLYWYDAVIFILRRLY